MLNAVTIAFECYFSKVCLLGWWHYYVSKINKSFFLLFVSEHHCSILECQELFVAFFDSATRDFDF